MTRTMDILAGYAAAADQNLVARFEAISSVMLFAPVRDLLPAKAGRVADIGAGTGRDAAWFAAQGHRALAVEPVAELRAAGMAMHRDPRIDWLDDRLPELAIAREKGPFDLVTLCAVWQHIDDSARQLAMKNLGAMVNAGGLLVMSLRHGLGAPRRPIFPVCVDATVRAASEAGFELLRCAEAPSLQAANRAAGIHWTWLALRMPLERPGIGGCGGIGSRIPSLAQAASAVRAFTTSSACLPDSSWR